MKTKSKEELCMFPSQSSGKTEQEVKKEEYKRFSEFWEHSREHVIDIEDRTRFLDWDKSLIGQFCFNKGFLQGKQEAKKELLIYLDCDWSNYSKDTQIVIKDIRNKLEKGSK